MNKLRTWHRLLHRRDGNVAMSFAIMMPITVAMAGMLVDSSVWEAQKASLQGLTDRAALAGAVVLNDSNYATTAKRNAAAIQAATDQIFASRPDLTPKIQMGPDNRSLTVALTETGIVSFGGVFGIERVDLGASSLAVADFSAGAACLLALNEQSNVTGITFGGSATFTAPGCIVWSNAPSRRSIVVQGSATVNAERMCAAGQVETNGSSASITGSRGGGCGKVTDPFLSWSPSPPSGCDANRLRITSHDDVTLWPGTYCNGLDVSSQGTVTLMPGDYWVKNGTMKLTAGGSVIGTDVGVYLYGSGSTIDVSGQQTVRLKARTVGDLKGKIVASDRRMTGNLASRITGGAALDLTGSIYLPNQNLTFAGNTVAALTVKQVIADTIDVTGTTTVGFKTDFEAAGYPRIVALVPTVRLAE